MDCKICFRKYDEKKQKMTPRVLSCGHTMCEYCCKKLKSDRQIICPFDRKVTKVYSKGHPDTQTHQYFSDGVDQLPKNFAILEVIEVLEKSGYLEGSKSPEGAPETDSDPESEPETDDLNTVSSVLSALSIVDWDEDSDGLEIFDYVDLPDESFIVMDRTQASDSLENVQSELSDYEYLHDLYL
ncbi:hypothetical protein GCK72_004401 [Caenorhabditis remanei]|uniref:RING-type domain-containing protein n=1 Tax=Caenorhabditis remanei TaxID=31234 RepID=A0A6A5HDJ7_CAERE|nr:hypothetical protein GCK72_004401 [Caenorhabditis remanei]KAF1764453.1 hypothetical protein GCK72_004401 [Caenorhabditis remanei]